MTFNDYMPKGSVSNKHMLTLMDYSTEEIWEILKCAIELKKKQYAHEPHEYLRGKTLAMIFAKSSTRTRISFEQGFRQLGGTPIFLSTNDIQLGRGEPIKDTVRVLERMNIDGIMIRTFKQSDLEELAQYGHIPIINGLTDDFHPCQVLADLLTVYEEFGTFEGKKLVFFGEGFNMANSLMLGCAKVGMDVCVCAPVGHQPDPRIVEAARKGAFAGAKVTMTDDPEEAIKGANAVHTDVFFSMGQARDPEKEAALMPLQVNEAMMKKAAPGAIFLHCLPAHRGEEVTEEVIEGAQSRVFPEAENRLHAQEAVMYLLMR
mgnify:FL=1